MNLSAPLQSIWDIAREGIAKSTGRGNESAAMSEDAEKEAERIRDKADHTGIGDAARYDGETPLDNS